MEQNGTEYGVWSCLFRNKEKEKAKAAKSGSRIRFRRSTYYGIRSSSTDYGVHILRNTLFTLRGKLHTSMQVDRSRSTLETPLVEFGIPSSSFIMRIYTPYFVRQIV